MNSYDKVILTDCDGVLMNWEYAFNVWMENNGYVEKENSQLVYDMGDRYGITYEEKKRLVKLFNESSSIGFLPPLRDAMHYVDLLHRKHGYVFHMITSLSLEPSAQYLRKKNAQKLFGKTVFEKFVFLDVGADKDDELVKYKDRGYIWIEDKVENAVCGAKFGLDSILVEHGHNMNNTDFPLMKNWKEIYEYIVG